MFSQIFFGFLDETFFNFFFLEKNFDIIKINGT